jgi:hypothetical protein
MKIVAAALLLAASLAVPATAHADCGDPDQPPCTGPVPTVDEVMGLLGELTDPNIPGANKGDIVTPAFDDRHARGLDAMLNACQTFGMLPPPFNVTNIQPAPNNMADATVSVPRTWKYRAGAWPVVLVNQGGRWMLTSDTAYDTARQMERNHAHGGAI